MRKMEKNIEEFMGYKNLIDWYFIHRDYILYTLIIVFIAVCLCGLAIFHRKNKKIEYKEIFVKSFVNVIILACVGIVFRTAGIELKFLIEYMPMLILLFATTIVLAIQICEAIKYYKTLEEVIKKTNTIFSYIIVVEVLLLATMARLEVIEIVAALACVSVLKEINALIDLWIKEKNEKQAIEFELKYDRPIKTETELFITRQKQVDNFCVELHNIGSEPFAVMISGAWGSGKTSFLNVLKSKMTDAEFVDVEGGFDYDVKGMLNDIEKQIQLIFRDNGVYTDKNGVVGKYFKNIGNMTGNAGFDWAAELLHEMAGNIDDGYVESKQKMNESLNEFNRKTGKRIFIIVDNMDRIFQPEKREKMLQLISECVGLNHCVTLFLVDYDKFSSEHMNKEFVEKYINRHLILCNVEFEEILVRYMDVFLTDDFLSNKSEYMRVNCAEFKRQFITEVKGIVHQIQERISENSKVLKENKTTEREIIEWQLNILIEAENRLQIRMKNPRKVKRFLDNIETMLAVADIVWFSNADFSSNEYSKCDWIKKIFEVAFLKAFLHEEFEIMIQTNDLDRFKMNKEKSYVVEYVVQGFSDLLSNRLEEEVAGLVIYRLYALDIKTDKTTHQRLIEELDGNTLKEENLQRYLDECLDMNFNHERIEKVIAYIENHVFQNPRNKCESILGVMSFISSKTYIHHENEYLTVTERVKELLAQMESSNSFNFKDINLISYYKKVLQRSVIFENQSKLCTLMGLLHDADLVGYFEPPIDEIHQLYELIKKVNNDYPINGFTLQDDETEALKQYIEKMRLVFSSMKYEYIKIELNYMLTKIDNMFKTLFTWFGEDSNNIENSLYNNYKGDFENEVLKDVDTFFKGITDIKKYVQMNPSDVIPGNAFIELVYKIEKKVRSEQDWDEEKTHEVIQQLMETFDYLQRINSGFAEVYGERWTFIKIRLFRMKSEVDKK